MPGNLLGACAGDCVRIVNETCGEIGWSYLANVVNQLRGADLPPLLGLAECGGQVGGEQSCLSLEQGMVTLGGGGGGGERGRIKACRHDLKHPH